MNIYETFFSDNNGDYHFFYNGKDQVLGVNYPDECINNESNHKYIRIGYINCLKNDPTDIVIVNEVLKVQLETVSSTLYNNNKACNVHITGVIKAGTAVQDTFKCECISDFNDVNIPEIYICVDRKKIDGISKEVYSIWVKTDGIGKVYSTYLVTHAANKTNIDKYHFDSGYELYLTTNDEVIVDTDTSDLDHYITSIKFCTGYDRFDSISRKIAELQNRPSLSIQSANVSFDAGFEPDYNGDASSNYQLVTPSTLKYDIVDTPFLTLDILSKRVVVSQDGTYQISATSGMIELDTEHEGRVSKIEMVPFVNNDNINKLLLQYDPNIKANQLAAGIYTVTLKKGDVIGYKFKFIDGKNNYIRNNGYTNINITKLI